MFVIEIATRKIALSFCANDYRKDSVSLVKSE